MINLPLSLPLPSYYRSHSTFLQEPNLCRKGQVRVKKRHHGRTLHTFRFAFGSLANGVKRKEKV